MISVFDIVLAIAALAAMKLGLARRSLPAGQVTPRSRHWKTLLTFIFGHRPIMAGRPFVGLMHLILVWGLVLFSAVVLMAQVGVRFNSVLAAAFSGILDLIGLALLDAILFFIIRRVRTGRPDTGPRQVLLPLSILLLVVISGFLAEGARLKLQQTAWSWQAPVGGLLAALPASPRFLQAMLRLHFGAALLFVALVPFTFMRHLYFTAVNLLHAPAHGSRALALVDQVHGPWGIEQAADLTCDQARQTAACVSCGRCDEQCPARLSGKSLSPRGIVAIVEQHRIGTPSAGLHAAISDADVWACTTCLACVKACPAQVDPLEKIIALRRHRVLARGAVPAEARPMLRNLDLFGDVNGKGAAQRAQWAATGRVPRIETSGAPGQVLLWAGCAGALHPQYRETTRQLARILTAAGVPFGTLGTAEQCCGDPARRLGDEVLFSKLATANIAIFEQRRTDRIVTLCPHCFHTLKNDYPRFGARFQVMPAAPFVLQLIRQGTVRLKYPLNALVAIHDPCYLARYNGIVEPLRELGRAIPGVVLTELARHGASGLCCGGGGGRMWLHETSGDKINHLRAREVAESRAAIAATACPYCLTMLEDGLKAMELEQTPRVMDIITLVNEAMA